MKTLCFLGGRPLPPVSLPADLQPLPQQSGSPASNGLVGEELLLFEKNHKVFQHGKSTRIAMSAMKNMFLGIEARRLPLRNAFRRRAPPEVPNVAPRMPHSSWAPGHRAGAAKPEEWLKDLLLILQRNTFFMTCSHQETGDFKWQCTWIYENIDLKNPKVIAPQTPKDSRLTGLRRGLDALSVEAWVLLGPATQLDHQVVDGTMWAQIHGLVTS